MSLNILSHTFRHGTLGFLGIEEGGAARLILQMSSPDSNIRGYILKNFENVSVVSIYPRPNKWTTHMTFSVPLHQDLRNPRKFLKSIVHKLAQIESSAQQGAEGSQFCWGDDAMLNYQ